MEGKKNMSRLLGISLIAGLGVAVGFGLSALLKGDEESSTTRTPLTMAYDMRTLQNIILVRASDTGSFYRRRTGFSDSELAEYGLDN